MLTIELVWENDRQTTLSGFHRFTLFCNKARCGFIDFLWGSTADDRGAAAFDRSQEDCRAVGISLDLSKSQFETLDTTRYYIPNSVVTSDLAGRLGRPFDQALLEIKDHLENRATKFFHDCFPDHEITITDKDFIKFINSMKIKFGNGPTSTCSTFETMLTFPSSQKEPKQDETP